MTDPVVIEKDGFVFRLDPATASWVKPRVVDRREVLPDLPETIVIKTNAVRTVLRVPMPEGVVFAKRYHLRGLLDRLKYLVIPSKAAAEWRAARAIAAAGLPTVHALLMGERRTLGILQDACFAAAGIENNLEFVPYIHEHLWDGTGESEANRARLLDQLAGLVRRFHDAGFRHHDMHGGNLLVTGGPAEAIVHLIDLHTVKVGSSVPRGVRLRNLAKLLHSLLTGVREGDFLRMLTVYEGDRPVLGGADAALAFIAPRVAALEKRRLVNRTKRCLRRSSAYDVTTRDGRRIHHRREIDAGAVLDAIAVHERSRDAGGTDVLKNSRRSALSRQTLETPDGPRPVVVKETKCHGVADRLKNLFRPPRAMASWVNGTGLGVRRVPAAEPLAMVLEGNGRLVGRSFLLMEDVASRGGDGTRLDLHILERYAGPLDAARREEKRELARAFGRFVADLHARGIYHRDLKAVNVFVRPAEDGAPGFILVDYDRVVFGESVPRRRRIKNLAQAAASIAVLMTKTDRLRFFRAYAFDADARENAREYGRGVAAECEKKIVVRYEPIE
ncbi:MAG: lipopolysaccharide kinase InaA family protein [Planctomycetota bacterium]